MFLTFPFRKHCFQWQFLFPRCKLCLYYATLQGILTKIRACEQLQKCCEHEQASTHLIFASSSSKAKFCEHFQIGWDHSIPLLGLEWVVTQIREHVTSDLTHFSCFVNLTWHFVQNTGKEHFVWTTKLLYWGKTSEMSQVWRHTFLNLRHNSQRVDLVIGRTDRPQENRICRFSNS